MSTAPDQRRTHLPFSISPAWRGTAVLAALVLAAFCGIIAFWRWAGSRPDYSVLRRSPDARWIRLPEPANPNARAIFPRIATFRLAFVARQGDGPIIITVAGLHGCRISLNGHPLLPPGERAEWYRPQTIDLTHRLLPGRNELEAVVENTDGPPVFRLACDRRPDLSTPGGWLVSRDGRHWFAPQRAAARKPFPVTSAYPSAWQGLTKRWGLLVELALLALGVLLLGRVRMREGKSGPREWLSPGRFRWLLLGMYAVLCVHNLLKLAPGIGFDVPAHHSYIDFLLKHHRLPLATDGWQMFEPPLFYGLGALVKTLAGWVMPAGKAVGWIRIVPMACGAGMIEICYRMARLIFPKDATLQRIAIAVGGFLPVNIYMSQYVGNEPLEAFLSALALYLGLRLLCRDQRGHATTEALALGLVLGLALLAKVNAVLLLVPLGLMVYLADRRGDGSRRRAVGGMAVMAAGCAAVSGWYYLRNWILLGRPFVGGWAARPGMGWWQDPGYRMAGDLLAFGHALTRPVYSAVTGCWDGLYSSLWLDGYLGSLTSKPSVPFWNPDLLAGAAVLAVPLCLLLIWGIIRSLEPGTGCKRTGIRFLVACGVLYLAAIVALYVRVPSYAGAKASYALALAPAAGLLAAFGAEPLIGRPSRRTVLFAYLFCWVGTVYCTYWAR